MNKFRNRLLAIVAAMAFLVPVATAAPGNQPRDAANSVLAKEIRKELVTLPFYGVFDNLAFQIDGETVTLYGQVVRPSTRKDAEKRVARIEGIDRVINKIEVLPVSSFDDSIRRRTYRAVFRSGSLYRYAMGANPSIQIIVNRGLVTLDGVVSREMDRRLAYIAANGVSGVFSVTNNLRVERDS